LLKPLGHPVQSAVRFFALVDLDERRNDVKWLARATDAMMNHWRSKNAKRLKNREGTVSNGCLASVNAS
jgi:hypothetical protein